MFIITKSPFKTLVGNKRLGYKQSSISIQTLSISEKKYSTTVDPLPSWNQGIDKRKNIKFYKRCNQS